MTDEDRQDYLWSRTGHSDAFTRELERLLVVYRYELRAEFELDADAAPVGNSALRPPRLLGPVR